MEKITTSHTYSHNKRLISLGEGTAGVFINVECNEGEFETSPGSLQVF